MKTIKFHLESIDFFYFDKQIHAILCRDFVKDVLWDCPSKITVWISRSKNGNIVIGKPNLRKEASWDYKKLGWKWYGQRSLQPLYFSLGGMLKPGRYNVYMSEGWV